MCGDCCKTFTAPVEDRERLIKFFEKNFGFKLKSYDIQILFKGECEHLENNKCKVYGEKRPCQKKHGDYFCKRHPKQVLIGQLHRKICIKCNKIRTFQGGTERDRQGICGNCWVW